MQVFSEEARRYYESRPSPYKKKLAEVKKENIRISEILEQPKYLIFNLVGLEIKEQDNVDFGFVFEEDNITTENYTHLFSSIELKVKGSDKVVYSCFLENVLVKQVDYAPYGTVTASKITFKKSFETAPRINLLSTLEKYILTDDLLWDFKYLERLIEKLSDAELDYFIEEKNV